MKKQTTVKKKSGMNKFLDVASQEGTQMEIQKKYAKELFRIHPKIEVENFNGSGLPLIHTQQHASSSRFSNYSSTGTAINEFIDNSIEANAENIFILVNKEMSDIYIIDDGTGMTPDILTYAVMWGGTHRSNNKVGWGRFGQGHPQAAMFLTREYETYSKTKDGEWHSVNISLDDIEQDPDNNLLRNPKTGVIEVPQPTLAKLPKEVINYLNRPKIKEGFRKSNETKYGKSQDLQSGTVTHIKSVDSDNNCPRFTNGYAGHNACIQKLLLSIGTTYRANVFERFNLTIKINETEVKHIDPLFLTPTSMFYKERGIKKEHTEEYENKDFNSEEGKERLFNQGIIAKSFDEYPPIPMTNSDGDIGYLRLRFALFSPKFSLKMEQDKNGDYHLESKAKLLAYKSENEEDIEEDETDKYYLQKGRYRIMTNNNGYAIITRNGRQIDIAQRSRYPSREDNIDQGSVSRPLGRYWAFEIDFDPTLDEFFGLTMDKQQITLHKKVWEKLSQHNIASWVRQNLHLESIKHSKSESANKKKSSRKTTAEDILELYSEYNPQNVTSDNELRAKEWIDEQLDLRIIKERKKKNNPITDNRILEIHNEIIAELERRRYKTEYQKAGKFGPIFDFISGKPGFVKVLLNQDHPFIRDFYLDGDDKMKNAIDVLFHAYAVELSKSSGGRLDQMQRVIASFSGTSFLHFEHLAKISKIKH